MDKNFYTYLEGLLRLSGIKADDPKLAELKEKLGDFSIGEESQRLINDNVMTREAAKSNSEIYNHVKASILDGIDKDHASIMEELGLGDDEKQEFSKLKTKDRTVALFNKIRDKHKKALDDLPKGAGKEEIAKLKDTYQKQIEELNAAIKTKEGEISRINQAHESQLTDLELNGLVKSKKYSNKYDPSHAHILANTLIRKAIEDEKVKLVRDANGINLKKVVDDVETDYFQNNEKVSIDGFINGVLSKNNLLAAQDTPTTNGTTVAAQPSAGSNEMAEYYQSLKASVTT